MAQWNQWNAALAASLQKLDPSVFVSTYAYDQAAEWAALEAVGSALVEAHTKGPLQVLSEDAPPTRVAPLWWRWVQTIAAQEWGTDVTQWLRECQHTYLAALPFGEPEALRRTQRRWDAMCSALREATMPATLDETLLRLEIKLGEVAELRTHAATLIQNKGAADPTNAQKYADALYDLRALTPEADYARVYTLRTGEKPPSSRPQPAAPAEPPQEEEPKKDPFSF